MIRCGHPRQVKTARGVECCTCGEPIVRVWLTGHELVLLEQAHERAAAIAREAETEPELPASSSTIPPGPDEP